MASSEGGYPEGLTAQASYQMLKLGNWGAVQSWFRKTYPDTPISLLEEVRYQAQQNALNTEAFRNLDQGDQFGLLLPQGADPFETREMVLTVGIPREDGNIFWTNARVRFTNSWTKAEIESEARAIAEDRMERHPDSGRAVTGEADSPIVELIRGLQL